MKDMVTELLDEFLDEKKSKTMKSYLKKLEEHDSITANHCYRVGIMAYGAAKKLGEIRGTPLDPETLLIAGLGHDIGKLRVNKETLSVGGRKLNTQEWKEIRRHPELSYEMLKEISVDAAEVALRHHQHQENSYPRGIPSGSKEIENMAILLELIDKYDAFVIRDRSFEKEVGVKEYLSGVEMNLVEVLYKKQIFTEYL